MTTPDDSPSARIAAALPQITEALLKTARAEIGFPVSDEDWAEVASGRDLKEKIGLVAHISATILVLDTLHTRIQKLEGLPR